MNDALARYKERKLRACQLKQLEILKTIDEICRRNNIIYWLDGGTLLGAVRHGGFIPWDDDIDIAMMKDDLERFKAIAPELLPEHLKLQTPENEPTKEPIVKVRDLNSLYLEDSDDLHANYNKGLYVDIFPFIPYPNVSPGFVKRVVRGISRAYSILHKPHYYTFRALAEWPWFASKLILFETLWAVANALLPKGDRFSNIPINNGYGITHSLERTFPLSTIEFEGLSFPAPHDVDAYLSDLYRNYMDIPPVEKRHIHAIFIEPDLTIHNS